MKKTSVIAINLKSARIPIVISLFVLSALTSSFLSKASPPLELSADIVHALISCGSALTGELSSHTGVFSLLEKSQLQQTSASKAPVAPPPAPTSDNKEILSRSPKQAADSRVEISNSTKHPISYENFLSPKPAFLNDKFSVLIVHTHTTESYTPSQSFAYSPTDTDRTTDKNFNMVRVGDEIEKVLTQHGITVYHDTTINDYPSYNGSYNRSASNITNYIKNDPSIKIVLDVHRDAIEGANGEKVKYTSDIDGKQAASIMLVVGSSLSGLTHDNWEENMRFAVQLQRHTASLYPSLCRPINFRSQRFNQQLAPGGIIVEVGTNGNTLDEALLGAHYFAVSLADFIENHS